MTTLHYWIRARRRREVAGLLAVVGSVLVTAGALGCEASHPGAVNGHRCPQPGPRLPRAEEQGHRCPLEPKLPRSASIC